jgi:uncharacterized protein (DUF2141 family)
VNGGAGGYEYRTNASAYSVNTVIGNLTAGDYTVTVKDMNGCELSTTAPVNVRRAANPELTLSVGDIGCYGGVGSIASQASSETDIDGAPGVVSWYRLYQDGNPYSEEVQTSTFDNLSAGNFEVRVQDNRGCENSASATVAGPNAPIGLSLTGYVDALGNNNGSIEVQPSGGWRQYTIICYRITNGGDVEVGRQTGDDLHSYTFSNLAVANYKIVAEDDRGCLSHLEQEIRLATGEIDLVSAGLKIYPNPSSDGRFTLEWSGGEDRRVTLEVYDMNGRLIGKTSVQTGTGGVRTTLDLGAQSRGACLLRIPELNIRQKLIIR